VRLIREPSNDAPRALIAMRTIAVKHPDLIARRALNSV
jgi:hypothetical protein